MKKKILIVSAYLYQKASPRALRTRELALEFARLGHEVTVISSIIDMPTEVEFKEPFKLIELGELTWKSPDFGNSKLGAILNAVCRRVMLVLFEYPFIQYFWKVRRFLKNEQGYDLLISIAFPHTIHWGVASIYKKKLANIWVADCGDPYALLQNDSYKKWVHFQWIEKWFMNKCNYVSIPIESARSSYFPEIQNKIRVIPQGLRFPQIEIKNLNIHNEIITFAYSGDIYPYQDYALSFFKQLLKIKTPYKFIIYSNGLSFFKQNIDSSLHDNCEFNEPISRIELIKKLSRVDFLLVFPYKDKSQMPFKLIDYTYLKKPILDYEADNKSIARFDNFLKRDYTDRYPGVNLEEYKIEVVAKSFIDLL